MSYPSLERFQAALQHPQQALLDADLKAGKVHTSVLGLPVVMCGGFALTYTVTAHDKKFAVRCFHRKSPDLEARYAAISAHLNKLASPYFLPFQFLPHGVRVDQGVYPVVKMAWAAGETLGDFVSNHYRDRASIIALRNSLKLLSDYLGSNQIAHGDIQPGNVMVAKGGAAVQLIDYDGMFVPAIQRLGASETGHRNFQHPGRSSSHFGPTLDRFSLICIDVALAALEAAPGLWDTTQSDSESFLFRGADYANPGTAPIFQQMSGMAAVRTQALALAAICAADFSAVPSLVDFRAGRNIPQARMVAAAGPSRYISQYPALNAAGYDLFARQVGNVVELIGKVTDVWRDKTRYGSDYVFINFGDWKRANSVKLTVWSGALRKVGAQISEALVGEWVSVVGLVEPPYQNKQRGYRSISIDITGPGQLRVITGEEAKFRLGGPARPQRPAPTPTETLNVKIQPVSQNERVLKQMQRATPTQPPPGRMSIQPRPTPSPSPAREEGTLRRWLKWLLDD